jgi:hypothetical protein
MTRVIAILILLNLSQLHAQLNERRVFYRGIRYQAMGGTMLAVANDETALLANPAGLGKIRDFYGTIFDPELELGSKAIKAYNAKAFTEPVSLKDITETMLRQTGDVYTSRQQIMPSFVAKNFGFALLKKTDLQVLANSATSVDAFYRDDLGFLLGYNLRLFEGRVKIGVTGKLISRTEVDQAAIDPTAQSMSLSSLATAGIAKQGFGFGFDTGVLLALPWTYLPTIGGVFRDVGGMSFTQDTLNSLDGATDPNQVKADLDVGISLFPIHANQLRSTFALEYKGLLTQDDQDDKAKLMHLGYELNYSDALFFRAGYNQRYWTAGFELASESFQFQFATYGEEIGTRTNPKEDRRWVIKVVYRF